MGGNEGDADYDQKQRFVNGGDTLAGCLRVGCWRGDFATPYGGWAIIACNPRRGKSGGVIAGLWGGLAAGRLVDAGYGYQGADAGYGEAEPADGGVADAGKE